PKTKAPASAKKAKIVQRVPLGAATVGERATSGRKEKLATGGVRLPQRSLGGAFTSQTRMPASRNKRTCSVWVTIVTPAMTRKMIHNSQSRPMVFVASL